MRETEDTRAHYEGHVTAFRGSVEHLPRNYRQESRRERPWGSLRAGREWPACKSSIASRSWPGPELISYDFRHFAVQSRGLFPACGYRGIETTSGKERRPYRHLFVASIKAGPYAYGWANRGERRRCCWLDSAFRTNAVLGRRVVPPSLKSSLCCDIFMTRIFPGEKDRLENTSEWSFTFTSLVRV